MTSQNAGLPPARQTSTADRVGWIAMGIVALLGFIVLGWATTLTAG